MVRSIKKILLLLLTLHSVNAFADSVDELGNSLTPLGGEVAGNADGTIPKWTGGITTPPAAYVKGKHFVDPYASDQILYTINQSNLTNYSNKLTEGHKALLQKYPDSYFLNVYPTKRSASAPQRIYDATKQNAVNAKLTSDRNGVENAVHGIPFPLPTQAEEVMFNHLLRYRGVKGHRKIGLATPTRGGNYTLVKLKEEIIFQYHNPKTTLDNVNNLIGYFKQEIKAPARLAGSILLVHETINQSQENRQAWVYNPGQRRVRRAPNKAFDTPGTASDGMRTTDQLDMFSGSLEKYDWSLKGKKEIYVPYNNYKLHSPELKHKDILTPLHINQAYPRYELHRVWVVEATVKPGQRHLYKRRTFYIDEDSWQILAVDIYDNRDQLWRVAEGFAINYYNVLSTWYTLEVSTDIQEGRYAAFGLYNEFEPYKFGGEYEASDFTPSALRREGKR